MQIGLVRMYLSILRADLSNRINSFVGIVPRGGGRTQEGEERQMEDNRLDAKQREELELLMKLPPKSREKLITLAEGMVMAAELQEEKSA